MGLLRGRADSKKRIKSGNGDGGGKLRDIYGQMFRYHHRMPDEIGRQNPKVLFEMLDSLADENEEIDYDELPEHLRMFYGV